MLGDDDVAEFWLKPLLDGVEGLYGAVVVQAAPQEQEAAVRVAVLQQLGDWQVQVYATVAVGMVVLILAQDAPGRGTDVTVQFVNRYPVGLWFLQSGHTIDDLEGVF